MTCTIAIIVDIYSVDIYDCTSNVAHHLFTRKLSVATPSQLTLLLKDNSYHVLLPDKATDVRLPGLMCVPPEIVTATYGDRMVYTRDVGEGFTLFYRASMFNTDVLPPVCLAMPPRPLQGADLAADPTPWGDEQAVSMFSFAEGCYYGWGTSELQGRDSDCATGSHDTSTSGGSSGSVGSDFSGDGLGNASDTLVLTIPCPNGGQAVARFMAA